MDASGLLAAPPESDEGIPINMRDLNLMMNDGAIIRKIYLRNIPRELEGISTMGEGEYKRVKIKGSEEYTVWGNGNYFIWWMGGGQEYPSEPDEGRWFISNM